MNMSGTTDMICIYSQNVRKNYVLVDSLLESQKDLYDIFFFFLNHQFVTRCSIAVCGRLSTTSSLKFWPQETKTPLIGIETQLESIEFKEKSK